MTLGSRKVDSEPSTHVIVEYNHCLNSVCLQLKFQKKILASLQPNHAQKFVVSFLGSSVTAGHDSPFNKSFPILAGELLRPAFSPLGIAVDTRNAAMGNNPCLPYDVCVKTFAGTDADIVHWEQYFNCGGDDGRKVIEFEQFIRQSLALPSQPVVIFSHSITPNWGEDQCKTTPATPTLTDEDKTMLELVNTSPIKIVSEMNIKGRAVEPWRAVAEVFRVYKMAGIQMWDHGAYEKYKCSGPYVKNWGCCSASW